jgi:peptide/nickel transport system substrate-binding protein
LKTRAAGFRLAAVLLVAAPLLGGVAGAPAATTGHYGGTLTLGTSTQPNSLDPTQSNDPGLRRLLPAYCLSLYTYASNHGRLELDPILAAAPPTHSADKLTYAIQLRKGIEFNDGTPFNAQAVVSSFQRYTTFPGSARANDFVGVDSATATGPYTVVYHLTQRNSAFTGNLYPLSPAAVAREGAGFGSDPICVGPFMVDSWTPGVQTTLVKSPYYYKRGAVYLDKIVFKVLSDIQADLAALQAGDIQAMYDSVVTPPTIPNTTLIKAAPLDWGALVINIGNKNGEGNLPYSNVGTPLAQSPKLRQAFEEAINRSTVSRVAWSGVRKPSCTLIPSDDNEWYAQTKVPCTPYDPKDAKRLVAVSGYPLPITVHLQIASGNSGGLAEGQIIQSEEAAVGFNVILDVLPGPTYSAALQSGHFDVVVNAQSPTDPDPNSYIYPWFDTAGAGNFAGYSNPRLDYVLANALKATDPKARAVDYRAAQQILQADRPVIVLRESIQYGIFDSDLSGIQLNPFGVMILANAQYKN